MNIWLVATLQLIILLLIVILILYRKCRSLNHRIEQFIEEPPPPKQFVLSKKQQNHVIERHVLSRLEALNSWFEDKGIDPDLNSINPKEQPEAYTTYIHRLLYKTENRCIMETLSPTNDEQAYQQLFLEAFAPLAQQVEETKQSTIDSMNSKWEIKLKPLEEALIKSEEAIQSLSEETQQRTEENEELRAELNELKTMDCLFSKLQQEREAAQNGEPIVIAKAISDLGKDHFVKLKGSLINQKNIVDRGFDDIDELRDKLNANTEDTSQELEAINIKLQQIKSYVTEAEVITHSLIDDFAHIDEHIQSAANPAELEELRQQLDQVYKMQSTMLRANSDYANIIDFLRQALLSDNIQTIANEAINILKDLEIDGGVEITTNAITILRETEMANSTTITESFKKTQETNKFVAHENATVLCYPHFKVAAQQLDKVPSDTQERFKEIFSIICRLAHIIIDNMDSQKEAEIVRFRLNQTVTSVSQTVKTLGIKLKLKQKSLNHEFETSFKAISDIVYKSFEDNEQRQQLIKIIEARISSYHELIAKNGQFDESLEKLYASIQPILQNKTASPQLTPSKPNQTPTGGF